jgi:hypothetical protein
MFARKTNRESRYDAGTGGSFSATTPSSVVNVSRLFISAEYLAAQ